ncbi:hypothetical protein [Cellulomonas sp. P5_C5]
MAGAQDQADWRSADELWLDHATLRPADATWLEPVRSLTLWAVKVPDGLLASLPNLEYLDLRGGTGVSVAPAEGCRRLRYLQVNQVRGVTDLAVVPTLTSLELLSLYGLPRVETLPSFAPLGRLRRVELGSLKGLTGLTGLHDAPVLEEILLHKAVGFAPDDAARLARHPTLGAFEWVAEDVPVGVSRPFRETVARPPARSMFARDWLARS